MKKKLALCDFIALYKHALANQPIPITITKHHLLSEIPQNSPYYEDIKLKVYHDALAINANFYERLSSFIPLCLFDIADLG